jgi:hypothetical protein
LWSELTARRPPSLNGHQERCLPHGSNPLHRIDSRLPAIPKRLLKTTG